MTDEEKTVAFSRIRADLTKALHKVLEAGALTPGSAPCLSEAAAIIVSVVEFADSLTPQPDIVL